MRHCQHNFIQYRSTRS